MNGISNWLNKDPDLLFKNLNHLKSLAQFFSPLTTSLVNTMSTSTSSFFPPYIKCSP